jgi:predicted CxxxxCH...CXXCH cytochrome family protein
MMFRKHSLRYLRRSTLTLLLVVAAMGITGCANDNSSGGSSSPADWIVLPSGGQHAKSATRDYLANGGNLPCAECHGADLSGGTSQVSCFANPAGCHHGPVSGWIAASPETQNHGVSAKQAPAGSGFASCQICHGKYFSGGDSKVSCFPCHGVNAPHPQRPWRGPAYTHVTTSTEDAQTCAQCHFPGSPNNPTGHPAAPADAGTLPGCFNSTLCHGETAAPHGVGTAWRDPNPQFHGLTAKQNLSYCQGCHGTPGTTAFDGGTASTSCQTAACHARAKAHTIPWYQVPQAFPAYVASHRDSGNSGTACAICHKTDGPGTGPDPNAPSCFSVSFGGVLCHADGAGGANHPVPFPGTTHTSADPGSFEADCSACHAMTGVSPSPAAPNCTVCHPSATVLPFANCTSCHARPPSGTNYPDVAGSHARHDALASVTGVCDSCHNGLGSGTAGHYDRANARPGKDASRVPPGDAAFLGVYNAKAGPAAFDNATLTCANVSCHGGVTAPNWRTGSIDGNSDAGCRQCHKVGSDAGNPENNSPFSGLHAAHLSTTVGGAILCTECHNMASGTVGALNHYKFLDTSQLEGPAGDTVAPNGSATNYIAANQTCGTFTCHTVVHVNFPWSGGKSHAVPFMGSNHTSVTSSTFAANCGPCHFETGLATKPGPTCTVCHQAGSPLISHNCTSCHGDPPSGATYPNVAGQHVVHDALPGTEVCGPCHNGLDTGSLQHYDRANALPGKDALRAAPGDVAFPSAYNAKSRTAAFSATNRTCSNVICHGGQTTPDWQTATANAIDVPNACLSCHVSGNTQYNSYSSGKHSQHIDTFGLTATTCKRCHDATRVNVSGHFQDLSTPVFEQPAAETILPALGYNGNTCNPKAGGLTGCHGNKKW